MLYFCIEIVWKSFKIKRLAKSTLPTETLAFEQALETCFKMESFLCELLNQEISNENKPLIAEVILETEGSIRQRYKRPLFPYRNT